MNPADLIAVISSALAGQAAPSGAGSDPFRAALRIGEVIEGRVLRSVGPGRYAVDFAGFERVVDSVIPFRTDEILYGRVVAIGERVELQRVRADAAARQSEGVQSLAAAAPAPAPVLMGDAIAPSRGRWSPEEWKTAERLAEDAGDSPTMSLAASAMATTGLPFSRGVLEFVHSRLVRQPGRGMLPTRPAAIRVETARAEKHADIDARNARSVAEFAELLRSEFDSSRENLIGRARGEERPGEASRASDPDDGKFSEGELGALLNVQIDGAVAHAVATLPLVVDGRLVEVDVALFQQDRKSEDPGKLLHGRAVVALTTDRLGRVEIVATLVGEHVQLSLGSDDALATEYMARYATGLRSAVEAGGWWVDEIRYRAGDRAGPAVPARAALEHLASRDSFNRLV
jgi:hypothetical protein